MPTELEAHGWNAIDAALAKLYADQEPRHWAPPLPSMLGGSDPLQGISAWPSDFGGTRHWHFVTYGFSDLYQKGAGEPGVSGYGLELTCRIVDPRFIDEPPTWPVSMLQNLARYVFRSGNVFAAGHSTTFNGPMLLESETLLVAGLFALDPQLSPIETPNGRVTFLQLVGITADEYDAIRDWDAVKFVELMREKMPALASALPRSSLLDDVDFARRARAGAERDGSSMGACFVPHCALEVVSTGFVLTVSATALDNLHRIVRGRLKFGRDVWLQSHEKAVRLVAGERSAAVVGDGGSELTLDAGDQASFLRVPTRRGDYPLPSGAGLVRVVPVEIWDGTRSRVERVVG